MFRQRFTELLPSLCVKQTFIECSPRQAARCRADAGAKHVERLQAQTQSVSLVTNHVFRRNFAALEFELADRMWRDHFSPLSDSEAGHARGNDEGRNLRAAVASCARARKDGVEISDAGVGNE